ncbi:MAG: sugar ABC transporter ATP-binding protein [Planctomycetaceae bacterium]
MTSDSHITEPSRTNANNRGAPPVLQVCQITKRFPGVKALKAVDLTLHSNQVLAVIGENGAGKSTLMKILAGVQQPDAGEIRISGQPTRIDSCRSAMRHGVVLIHQELNLADNLTVGANIFLGREPKRCGLIDHRRIDREARKYLEMVGLDVPPSTVVNQLAIGHQQMVEIAKALSVNARVLIMDEPTSSLSGHETAALFDVVRDLRSRGVSIIYISHRLAEVTELADAVTVLRDGANAGTLTKAEINHANMVRLMVGRDVAQFYARQQQPPGQPALELRKLVTSTWPQHAVSLTVHSGEIVGLAGLVGAGRTELLRTIFGIDHSLSGQILVSGNTVDIHNPRDAIQHGLSLVPEDRKQHGLILEMMVGENIGLAGLHRYRRAGGFLNQRRETADALQMIEQLKVRTTGAGQAVQFLSGGNQQKVVIGKWLSLEPKVLLLDEPTRGIDVGAKQEIFRLMEKLASQGVAILFVSSEMEEILGMSDRACVMHEGRLAGELSRDELNEVSVMTLATGEDRSIAIATRGNHP